MKHREKDFNNTTHMRVPKEARSMLRKLKKTKGQSMMRIIYEAVKKEHDKVWQDNKQT